jgi:acetyl esterase
MPLDPQAQRVIEQTAALGLPPAHTVSPQQARINRKSRPMAPGPEVGKVDNRLIPGPETAIPVRIYTPEGSGPFPTLVWFHGGGWVVGDLDTVDATARRLTVGVGCVVVSVGYRLAPETKFPGAADDCYAATVWAVQNASQINAAPNRVAIGGESAGGNLAAAVALMARDRRGPSLACQVLVYPVTAPNFETVSYLQNAEGYNLTRATMMWYWDQYLREASDASHPYAAPLLADDLSSLPAALVITAEYDPLCDEGEAYAERLKAAGVPTAYTRYEGMIHGFFGMPGALEKGKQAVTEATEVLRRAFSA